MPAPNSHTEGRVLPYDAEAAPVERSLSAAVTAAQDKPSLAPWLGPAEQQAYGSMPAAAVHKMFEHSTRRMTPWRVSWDVGSRPRRGRTRREGTPLRAEIGSR